MKEIKLAKHSGFCFGVREALKKAEETIDQNQGKKIYTCGPIIHNKTVTDELEEKGVSIISCPDDAESGAIVIIRSHGEPEKFYQEAKAREIKIVDATCPFVKRIQQLVKDAKEQGRNIVVVGDKNHPEVIGINGWCDNEAYIVLNLDEAKKIKADHLFIVAQTTLTNDLFQEIAEYFKKEKKDVIVHNTICSATAERQKSCMETAIDSDLMVIIGGSDSSNSKKLYEISKKYCENTYFVENKEYLPLKEVEKCNKIGIAAGASTPERIIKEVIATMSELFTESKEENLMHGLMEEIEKSLRLPRSGEIVNGEVIQVSNREIVVNLGCKKDGIIPRDELTLEGDQELTDLFKEGDEIQAKVLKTDDGDGNILLSKKKLEVNEHWDEINNALENKSFVNAKIVKEVKGGVIAVYKEVSGFIPLSQLSDKFIEKADEFVGKTLPVKVTRVDQKRNKAVFSHKAYLTEERQKKVQEIWDSLNIGDVVEGTVMRFTEYGAFVDIGGIDGLLHISEISWGKLKHPQEALKIGEKVQVKILSMNTEKGKISLGLKQNRPEPWSVIDEKYQVGQIISGKVVQIKDYGAFVELEPGLDGLVHISEIAYKRVTNIAEEISVGQEVTAKILEIDKERKRISLSIKETLEPPLFSEEEKEEAPAAAEEAAVEETTDAE
ncbi:bifunctional 4-hydroxy-3-methylbut-2-enyl diphosphate reductase/30S ribosomal protein S1 [Sinanaerobacter chloroacetimidivorans]|uniref:4-hydroxy-3-methylbut-2-enyl diphosphate reductase n=1 Tax=Sinanaerobacter chloroacetimidivorans TaxID=2818044 RepID=A0A8J8AZC6_9FIRM|nr:bifunctional 4-hydroxy-3-methylbut-2-enyl diphosphate reductase/30S ribosomal protein S1 [Sinanaerobacter chloroacetimidivorans]MBR0596378.1 bifunctional 4-hydroxy-3-methylbut-2-enyl diphosphate reductase/30S ribosomal protein S1 [Sinanaerobacter chloroacetimidivorans]